MANKYLELLSNKTANNKVAAATGNKYLNLLAQRPQPIEVKPTTIPTQFVKAPEPTMPKTFQRGVMENGKFVVKDVTIGGGEIKAPTGKELTKQPMKFEGMTPLYKQTIQPIIEKVSQIPEVQNTIKTIAQRTSGTGIIATIQSANPDKTFEEAYKSLRQAQAGDTNKVHQFLWQLTDTAPQTALGVSLSFVPFIGKSLSTVYWTSLSASEQIEREGKITTPTNIAIDVLGDRMLGNSIQALFKAPAKTLKKIAIQNFGVEGGTEVGQDLGKMADRYRLAASQEEKNAILQEAKEYFTSGQIVMTGLVGGITGAGISGVVYTGTKIQGQPQITEQPTQPPAQQPTKQPKVEQPAKIAPDAQKGVVTALEVEKGVIPQEVQAVKAEKIPKAEISIAKEVKPEILPTIKKPTPQETVLKSRVYERMKQEHPELEGEVTYQKMKLEEDAQKALDLVEKNPEKAYNIAMGKEKSSDITSTNINIVLAEKALVDGNYKTYSQLVKTRSLAQTRRGQELVAEKGSVTNNSTSRYVKELISDRLDKLGKDYFGDLKSNLKKKSLKERATAKIDSEVLKLESKIKTKKVDLKTALNLLDKITCPA